MVVLDELKSYLRDLNYPGINIMQDNEVAEIFSKKNRLYFLIWFVQQWDGDIVLPMDERSKVNVLADILCDNGFATSQKSIKFVQDDFELMPNEQLEIMYRMLYNLSILKSGREGSDMFNVNCPENMAILSELDVNIFPKFGRIQTRKPQERVQKLKQLQDEIKQLENEIKCFNINEYNEENLNTLDKSDSENLIKQVSVLMNNSSFLLKEKKNGDKGIFDQHFQTIVTNCNKNISDVLKLYGNKKSICDFQMNSECLKKNHLIEDILKRVSMFSQEILEIN